MRLPSCLFVALSLPLLKRNLSRDAFSRVLDDREGWLCNIRPLFDALTSSITYSSSFLVAIIDMEELISRFRNGVLNYERYAVTSGWNCACTS